MGLRLSHIPRQFVIVDQGERCVLTYTPPTTEQRLSFQLRGMNTAAMEAVRSNPEQALEVVINSISKEKMINSALEILIDAEGYDILVPDPDGEEEYEGERLKWVELTTDIDGWKTHLEVLAGHHLIQLADHVFGPGVKRSSQLRLLPKETRESLVEQVEKSEHDGASLKKK